MAETPQPSIHHDHDPEAEMPQHDYDPDTDLDACISQQFQCGSDVVLETVLHARQTQQLHVTLQ